MLDPGFLKEGEIGQEAKFEIYLGYLELQAMISLPVFLWGGGGIC